MTTTARRPLDGMLVLDLGQIYNGPYCGLLLGFMGARVLKIESPEGDIVRRRKRDVEPYPLVALNSNKESVVLDLKHRDGKALFVRLARRADVVVVADKRRTLGLEADPSVGGTMSAGEVRKTMNPVIETYSRLASEYDDPRNINTCWGSIAQHCLGFVTLEDKHKVVADVGCGTGRELAQLASRNSPEMHFIGVEPAENMRKIAFARTAQYSNVRVLDGSFEKLPLESGSVDYLYSILAFHWTTDLDKSAGELARVLQPSGEMDLMFIGRHNGREFIQKTTPVFFKYLTPVLLVEATSLRKHLTVEAAAALFRKAFGSRGLSVTESYHTYYDTLDGHWGWWVRIEGQFMNVPQATRAECDQAVRAALSTLATDKGIPYTIHLLHVRLRHT